jgi:class 3 adenylate cyclase
VLNEIIEVIPPWSRRFWAASPGPVAFKEAAPGRSASSLKDHAGREVKHGDGMASFASIAQALDCATSIQKALAPFNVSNAETPLHLRIGLSAGEPVQNDNDLFGATVQLAARLCAQAKPDQILAAEDLIRHHAGDRSLFSELGLITPKGFDQPIRVYEVRWRDQTTGRPSDSE